MLPTRSPVAAAVFALIFLNAVWSVAANEQATAVNTLSAGQIAAKVQQATVALNDVARKGATQAQADQLFALYSADFIYQHDKYGGIYPRDQLYRNTLRMIQNGGDNTLTDRYQLLQILPGEASAAVLRLTRDGQQHLSVFEFSGDKISKIKEYW